MKTMVYVGANQGLNLQIFSKYFSDIVAFEPVPFIYKALCERIGRYVESEGKGKSFRLVNAACSAEEGTHEFYFSENHVSSSLSDWHQDWVVGPNQAMTKIQVRTLNLGRYLESVGVERVDFLVLDTQGYDAEILSTLSDWLAAKRVAYIMAETHADSSKIYEGVDNSFSRHVALLSGDYEIVGYLEDGKSMSKNLPDTKEWDTFWAVKDTDRTPFPFRFI